MPDRNQNLIGKQFGHLTVIAKSDKRGTQNEYKWVCKCDCGRITEVTTGALNSGTISSCGHVRMRNIEKFREDPKLMQERHLKQLNNRPASTNKTGYRNISMTKRNGRWRYRVAIQYNRKQHSQLTDTLEEALAAREKLRKKWWPNYKDK